MRIVSVFLIFFLLFVFTGIPFHILYAVETSGRIVISGKQDWERWQFPRDVLKLDDNGLISSKVYRKNIDACLDAKEFVHDKGVRGGILGAGTNPKEAANIIDGNLETFWEPAKGSSLEDWWVEIDLGRAVWADSVVIRFAPEGQGDPFLQFKVLVSDGSPQQEGIKGSPLLYTELGRTDTPNEFGRVFRFKTFRVLKFKPHRIVEGDIVQYLFIRATASKGDKKELVSRERYDLLPDDWRGAVEYYRITATGKEEEISEEGYYKLTPEQRGSIKYWRREVPRLSEVEVWSEGDNIALGLLERGGSINIPIPIYGAKEDYIIDGSFVTYLGLYIREGQRYGEIEIDLGAVFWVNKIRFVMTRPTGDAMTDPFTSFPAQGNLGTYKLYVCDRNPESEDAWKLVRSRQFVWDKDMYQDQWEANTSSFPLQKVHYIKLHSETPPSG